MLKTAPEGRWAFDRFVLLLGVTVITVGMLLLVDLDASGGLGQFLAIVVSLLTAATLLLAVIAAGIGRRGLIVAIVAAVSLVGTTLFVNLVSDSYESFGGIMWLLLVVCAPFIALRRLNQHRRVTIETIAGAVSVYLLLAIAATYLFLALDVMLEPSGGFFGHGEPTTSFMYFSLVTLTTLGYGDLAPAHDAARAVAVWESVIGQVFLVVVVARLVSIYSTTFSPRGSKDSTSSE
jgi:hypothetical protein